MSAPATLAQKTATKAWLIVLIALCAAGLTVAVLIVGSGREARAQTYLPTIPVLASDESSPSRLIENGRLMRETVNQLRLELSPDELADEVTVGFDENADVATVRVGIPDDEGEEIADRLARRLAELWNVQLSAARGFLGTLQARRDRLRADLDALRGQFRAAELGGQTPEVVEAIVLTEDALADIEARVARVAGLFGPSAFQTETATSGLVHDPEEIARAALFAFLATAVVATLGVAGHYRARTVSRR